MSTTRWIIETECDECGAFHFHGISRLKPGGDPESSIAYCTYGSSRTVVDPANLPPERVERAAIRLCHWDGWDYGEPYDQWPVQITDSDGSADGSAWEPIEDAMQDYRDRALAIITAFLSDPEQDKL